MDTETIRAIEAILKRNERVELMKGPNGEIKVLRIRRELVAINKNAAPSFPGTA